MSHAQRAFVGCVGIALLVGAVVACSAGDFAAFDDTRTADDGGAAGEANPSAAGDAFGAAATGVVLVHAAAFPSFRLCFGNQPKLKPQPETKIMPESNVVGVETGSFVRLPPMDAPGIIYVIDETTVRDRPESCEDLLANVLRKGNDYDVAGSLDAPVGQGGVDVVALTGCGNTLTIANLHVAAAACGDGFDANTGNLRAKVTRLEPNRSGATTRKLPVQLFQLSTAVDALAASGPLAVSFGALPAGAGALAQRIEVGMQTTLDFDQTNESVYGTHGFRITVAGATVDQSLATVQDLSSSNELPSTYYGVASNYALLLLGNPAYPTDAGAASARFGMHLLAVPVLDPAAADAGADAGAAADAAVSADAGH